MARGFFAILCAGLATATAVHAGDRITQAGLRFQAGDFDAAQNLYATVPADDPAREAALRQLGAIALYENRLDMAGQYLNAALAQDAADTTAQTLLAEVASRKGDFATAASRLQKADRPTRAFALFDGASPYRVLSARHDTRLLFVQTDPLPAIVASVNGEPGLFLLDTGAAEIVLDPAFAAKAGIAGAGDATGTFAGGRNAAIRFGRIARLDLGTLAMADIPAMLVDTSGFAAAADGKAVAGVIGTEFLMRFRATIDYPQGQLLLQPPDAPLPAAPPLAEIPFYLVKDHYILARGTVDDTQPLLFFVDTGLAGSAFTAPASTLRAAKIALPAPAADGDATKVGQSASAPIRVRRLSLGLLQRENLEGLYGPFPPALETSTGVHIAGIVSHAFFRPYAVTFDFARMVLDIRKPAA